VTEQQAYEVLEQGDGFELRRYPPHLVAEVELDGSFEDVGNRAFGALFGYISGSNESRRSVSMTAPVVQQASSPRKIAMTAPVVQTDGGRGGFVVAFVLPASMTLETAPTPTNPDVRVREVPERVAAAVAYSGRWTPLGLRAAPRRAAGCRGRGWAGHRRAAAVRPLRPPVQAVVPPAQRGRPGRRATLAAIGTGDRGGGIERARPRSRR
jgi:hypothetical protein